MLEACAITVRAGPCPIVAAVSLGVARGECVGLIGPNGAGKSTLLRALAGVLRHEGEVLLDGAPSSSLSREARARRVAYLPQEREIAWPLRVREVVALGRLPCRGVQPCEAEAAEAVARALAETGLAGIAERPCSVLSGGEKARVLLARALAVEAPLLLADEPVAGLDPMQQLAVMALLRQRARNGTGVLAVLHDLTLAARYCDRIIVMDRGEIAAAGPPVAVLDSKLIEQVFGIVVLAGSHEGEHWLLPWQVHQASRG